MASSPTWTAADRVRIGHCADYVLRTMRLYTELMRGDPVRALVFIAASRAGTQHLKDWMHDGEAGRFIPDELRHSISISSLAQSLGLPVETTRRHVIALCADGWAERTADGGVSIASRHLDKPELHATVEANVINLGRLTRSLARAPRA